MGNKHRRWPAGPRFARASIACAAVAMLMVCPAMAQVQTDGTMGPATTLSGDMVIGSALGKQVGTNLFHSFSLFNVNTGESVLFTSSVPTTNIIGRVTGSTPSWIDGSLESNVRGAALWLINPNGVTFGKNAEVYVPGSFHVSTADYLVFGDGKRYNAKPNAASDALLSVANPSAFGFLGTKPAPITVTGSAFDLAPVGTLSFVGGDISIAGSSSGHLDVPGGRIDLVSVAGPGEAKLNAAGAMDVTSFSSLGTVSLSNGAHLDTGDAYGWAPSGGSVFIRGGRFVMTDRSSIRSQTEERDGGPVDIAVTGDVILSGASTIQTSTWDGAGRAGNVSVNAGGAVTLSNQSQIGSLTSSGSNTSGSAGSVSVSARDVSISGGSKISTQNWGSLLKGGDVTVKASGTIAISGGNIDYGTGITSTSTFTDGDAADILVEARTLTMNGGVINDKTLYSTGASGNISVKVGTVTMANGAIIDAGSLGYGPGGVLSIQASERVSMAGGSSVQSRASETGAGGWIQLTTPDLSLTDSSITTSASGPGNAGNISVAVNTLALNSSTIVSESHTGGGPAGKIAIVASSGITMKNVGESYLDQPQIATSAFGNGNAGSITISSPKLAIDDGRVDSNTYSAANSGSITLNVNDLVLTHGGRVETNVSWGATGQGGTIEINAPGSISCSGLSSSSSEPIASTISAATGGRGNAGRISITTGNLALSDNGNIYVGSLQQGAGGDLRINAGAVDINGVGSEYGVGLFSGANGSGKGGNIILNAQQVNLTHGVISASSTGTGNAGSVTVNVGNTLDLRNYSGFITQSKLSAGGNINVTVGNTLYLQDSVFSASANGVTPTDNGGNLTIRAPQFMVLNKADLLAQANAGNGGNITLGADYVLKSAESTIDASSQQGLSGQILLDSPNEVTGTVAVLKAPSLDISEVLRERCAARVLRERSSFVIEGKGGMAPRPGGFLFSPSPGASAGSKAPAGAGTGSKEVEK